MQLTTRHKALSLGAWATAFLLGTAVPVVAQDAGRAPWGQQTPTEYSRTRLGDDPTAGASVSFDRGQITVGPGLKFTFQRHRRVQIFRHDASFLANIKIPYHKSEKIEKVEAHTVTRDGRVVDVASRVFITEETGDWRALVFAFPEVAPGCVIEYRYELSSRNFYYLRPWAFQDVVPTEYSELAVRLPEGFEYTAVVNNSEFVRGPDTSEVISLVHGSGTVRQFRWHAIDLAPLTTEPLVASILNHRTLLDFQVVRFNDGSKVMEFVDSWNDLAEQVKRAYSRVLEPNHNWPRWDKVAPLLSSRELIERIYEFVRDSVAVSGAAISVYNGGLRDAARVLSDRRGNALEKNLLFISLLRYHDIDAWPVLISRRSHLRFDQRDHRLEQFDHAIVCVEHDGEQIFCETNVPNAWLGYLPPDDQVDAGVVIGYPSHRKVLIDLPAPPVDNSRIADGSVTLRADGSAHGTLELTLGGQAAFELLCALADHDTVGYLRREWLPDIAPTAIEITRSGKHGWAPILMRVEFDWTGAATVDADRLTIFPGTIRALGENPLMTSARHYPISFESAWTEECRMVWHVPDGFRLNTPPPPHDLIGDGFVFRSSIGVDGDSITARRFWRVERRDFGARQFPDLRSMFNTVSLAQHRIMVLSAE